MSHNIRKRTSAKGVVSYYAEVRIHEGRDVVARKCGTFTSLKEAKAWAARTEIHLADAGIKSPLHITVRELITSYIEKVETFKTMGRSRKMTLQSLAKDEFFDLPARSLTGEKLTEYAAKRQAAGVGPSTVMADIVNLRGPFRDAKPLLNLDLDDSVFKEWIPWLRRRGLVSASGIRARRLQAGEMDRLRAAFRKRAKHTTSLLPMSDIVEFAIASCMRQSEITRITWADLDEEASTVWVRLRKNPLKNEDDKVPLTPTALAIIQKQPRDAECIFPYEPRSISAAFTRVAAQCGIEDLHFHDLRREGISRLAEAGLTQAEVAEISGHKNMNILQQVYTALSADHMRKRLSDLGL